MNKSLTAHYESFKNNHKLKLVCSLIFVLIAIAFFAFSINRFVEEKSNKRIVQTELAQKTVVPTKQKVSVEVGSIAYVKGDALFKQATDSEDKANLVESTNFDSWKNVDLETKLEENTLIKTKEGSNVILALNDGSYIRMDETSMLLIETYNNNLIQIENLEGQIYSRVASAARTFEVVVSESTYRSTGTAYMTINTKDKKGVIVYEGSVLADYKGDDNLGNKIEIAEGNSFNVLNSTNKNLERKIEKFNTDDLKNNEFIIWNTEEDKKHPDFKDKLGILGNIKILNLQVLTPVNNSSTKDEAVKLTGETEVGAVVIVNSVKVKNIEGKFSTTVKLVLGKNTILVEATKGDLTRKVEVVLTRITPTVSNNTNNNTDPYTDGDPNDTTPDTTPDPPTPPAPTTPDGFNLTAASQSNGIKLSWTLQNVDLAPYDGFFVVYSNRHATPVYPFEAYPLPPDGDAFIELNDVNQRTYVLPVANAVYNVRLCLRIKTTSMCNSYSNKVSATAPNMNLNIVLETTGVAGKGYTEVKWTLNYLPENGYILVYSNNPTPSYPYTGVVNSSSAFSHPKPVEVSRLWRSVGQVSNTYYARVCARNYANECFYYSNEITTNIANY